MQQAWHKRINSYSQLCRIVGVAVLLTFDVGIVRYEGENGFNSILDVVDLSLFCLKILPQLISTTQLMAAYYTRLNRRYTELRN